MKTIITVRNGRTTKRTIFDPEHDDNRIDTSDLPRAPAGHFVALHDLPVPRAMADALKRCEEWRNAGSKK